MFLVPICFIFKFKTRFVNVKRIQATFVAFPEDGGQKEIIQDLLIKNSSLRRVSGDKANRRID